ncbi:hypothetical protein A2392_01095 [Candidatus Kaiserbacteria bacterium RIFOXYB1_FULL_46_14]|uniref:Uncharacterized protein n=1 Tax=Candidatus Kaiserbacteria bacterium RIFOXYB1_FULL_46_14 TaxID=1798531 RepID=A0A1F6FJK1_9BACT|nr:MAG: hypothetical protein A2392_01095 [Candidatus Kaiserbacteria bacterium RIFOXYB1_FULL_46_14]
MYIKVKVTPGSKRERVTKESDTLFRMEVKEPAERNLANERVKELLREALGLTVGRVRLVAGHRSQSKVFDVLKD